jgi:hypothetical protein
VQSIQTPTNTVRLVANRRTAVRVFVDSGITNGFDFGTGLGPNRVGDLHTVLVAENLDTGDLFDCGLPWPGPFQAGPGLNRDLLTDSINFDVPLAACDGNVQFRATVRQAFPPGSPPAVPAAPASGNVSVSFTAKSSQMILPFLIADPASASPPPTMADLHACLAGPATAHPIPENGFILNPEIRLTLSGIESLSSGANWSWLVMRLQTMAFLFASQPTGGVRMGVVPNDIPIGITGMALPRTGAPSPAFIVVAGSARWCTHEFGHAAGLLHVNCGGAAGPHGGLPLTTTDPGLNVSTRTLVASGANEAMGYCSPPWPTIEHWEHMFNSIPFY